MWGRGADNGGTPTASSAEAGREREHIGEPVQDRLFHVKRDRVVGSILCARQPRIHSRPRLGARPRSCDTCPSGSRIIAQNLACQPGSIQCLRADLGIGQAVAPNTMGQGPNPSAPSEAFDHRLWLPLQTPGRNARARHAAQTSERSSRYFDWPIAGGAEPDQRRLLN
jgi:hypothetical protein